MLSNLSLSILYYLSQLYEFDSRIYEKSNFFSSSYKDSGNTVKGFIGNHKVVCKYFIRLI